MIHKGPETNAEPDDRRSYGTVIKVRALRKLTTFKQLNTHCLLAALHKVNKVNTLVPLLSGFEEFLFTTDMPGIYGDSSYPSTSSGRRGSCPSTFHASVELWKPYYRMRAYRRAVVTWNIGTGANHPIFSFTGGQWCLSTIRDCYAVTWHEGEIAL
jgi:hypothetical protein